MKRVLLVYNGSKPNSYFAKNILVVINFFISKNYEVIVFATQSHKNLQEKLNSYLNIDLFVISGGDGLLHEFVNSQIDFNNSKLLYFPTGTVNDFGYSLGMQKDIAQNLEIYEQRKTMLHNIGIVNDIYFNYVVAFGPFTGSAFETNQNMKNSLGPISYLMGNLSEFRKFKKPTKMCLTIDDSEIIEANFVSGIIANSSSVAGLRNLFSNRNQECDYYDLLFITDSKNLDPLLVAHALNHGVTDSMNNSKFIYRRCKKVKVDCLASVQWTVDGERGPKGKLEIVQSEMNYEVFTNIKEQDEV